MDDLDPAVWAQKIVDAPWKGIQCEGLKECATDILISYRDAVRQAEADKLIEALTWGVEFGIKQVTERDLWPKSWDAGFPSYKAAALVAWKEKFRTDPEGA